MKLKNLLCCAMATVMLAGSTVVSTVSANAATDEKLPFSDVKEKNWFYDSVKFVYDEGIINGYTDGTFKPKENLTRAEFVTILGRLAGATSTTRDTFTDTKKNTWYSEYIGWAVENGIITGFPDNTFRPNDKITREQIAAAISRYIEAEGINMPRRSTAPDSFADEGKISKWAKEYMEVLRRAGIFNGDQNENCNPQVNISRAEAATVIVNLIEAEALAWQGYSPDTEADGYVMGAEYLYWGGTNLSTTMATELDESGEYPTLLATYDADIAEDYNRTHNNVIGVCTTQAQIDLEKTPYVKIAYKYTGYSEPDTLTGYMAVNPLRIDHAWVVDNSYVTSFYEPFSFTKSGTDAGFSTAVADLTAVVEKWPDVKNNEEVLNSDDFPHFNLGGRNYINTNYDVVHLFASAFSDEYTGDGRFELLYMAFFETEEAAEAFTASAQSDYLKNYYRYTDLEYGELNDEIKDEYDEILYNRIEEILNAENAITPEAVKAAGGTCYYVSSLNGDDKNNGITPETPFKTTQALWEIKAGGLVQNSKAKAGDAVFFERGSEFYPDYYLTNSKTALKAADGVSYSAYGEGEKPRFYGCLNFTEYGDTGEWLETKWENVYELKPELIDEKPEYRTGGKNDVGFIAFDDGEYMGIRVYPEDNDNPFGDGKRGQNRGLACNGAEYFPGRAADLTNPGTALQNDLEFIYDGKEGRIYLYCEGGNPSERFDNIRVPRGGSPIGGYIENGLYIIEYDTIDNLAILYSSDYAVRGGSNITVINCEIGFVGGTTSSVESGFEAFGGSTGIRLINNFVHDIGDGPLSLQSTEEWDQKPHTIEYAELADNVVLTSGNGFEIWNHSGFMDGYGNAINTIENLYIHGNIFGYIGWGLTQRQGYLAGGQVFCTYGEMKNCVNEDNIIMYPNGNIYGPHVSSDYVKRGWQQNSNTYIFNSHSVTHMEFMGSFVTQNSHSYAFKGS